MTADVIFYLLTQNSGVTTATDKGNSEYNIFPVNIPQGTSPTVIRFMQINTIPDYCKDGNVSVVDSVRVQVDCFSDKYSTVKTLAGYVRTALDGKSGTIAGIEVDEIYFETQNDIFEPEKDENGIIIFRKSLDFTVRLKK